VGCRLQQFSDSEKSKPETGNQISTTDKLVDSRHHGGWNS
jgi:hypothetical protein